MREEEDHRADDVPVRSLDSLFEEARRPRVEVREFERPHDMQTTWKDTKRATAARKKAATRSNGGPKPSIARRASAFMKKKGSKDEDGVALPYLLGGVGAAVGLLFLMK
jgi:hypothetical protein